jgi:hypothetical protein
VTPRRAVVTSNVRFAAPPQPSGYLRVVDLDTGVVLLTTPMAESLFRAHDPNPRGGQRGGRGLSVHGGRLVVANAERIFVLDTSWRLVDELSHPLAADIHDVLAEERGIWVASTACDGLVLLGWDGTLKHVWTYRDHRKLVKDLGLPRSALEPFQRDFDYRDPRYRVDGCNSVHLNSVAPDGDGLLVMFGRMEGLTEETWQNLSSVVVRVSGKGKGTILCRSDGLVVPNHNVAREGELILFNDSNASRLVAYDPAMREERLSIEIPGSPPYARGLSRVGPNRWLVGSQSPLAVYAIDLERGETVREYPFESSKNESVYAIAVLPDEFAEPPRLAPGNDPYAFWMRASPPPGVTPIPV